MPTFAQLIDALPHYDEYVPASVGAAAKSLDDYAMRPVPIGRFRRLGLLGTLQAKIAAAYAFYWIRGWFKNADQREKLLAETHWQTAIRVLDSMSYLRGAAMKVGQTLANFPDIVPREFVETLDQLHFDAPPMHWSLLREMVYSELGDEPENVFASFDKRAFAAASLGQVHAARLKTGEEVAVKIQYPGIARTIREDTRNLQTFMLPARLSRDWENVKDQMTDLRTRLERETNYVQEAATLERVRPLYRDDEGIVVPRVYLEFSTSRLLTMERLKGMHVDDFLATNPSQERRNEVARKFVRAWYRLMYAGRLLNADMHPGNFIFMEDDRLGMIDFGFMVEIDDALWEILRKLDRPLTTGSREERVAAVKEWSVLSDDPADQDQLRLSEEFADWEWRARYCGGEFDFGNEAEYRRGIDLLAQMVRKRYSRARPYTPAILRQALGWHSMLYRLGAKIDLKPIVEEEVRVTGWDRSDYA
jgi:predicted unusual protein kinase regulating ubiquinone biosynthesis (AarF/ABC1/UbiB family)